MELSTFDRSIDLVSEGVVVLRDALMGGEGEGKSNPIVFRG